MPLFKKKKEGMPAERFELPELPSFSEMQQIKEAVNPIPEMPRMPMQPQQAYIPSMQPRREEERMRMPEQREQRRVTQEISEPIIVQTETEFERPARMKEPIFVKIDKFRDALANFEIIKEKIDELDNLLKKINETKAREQEELVSWEKEVEDIKAKVKSIDDKLFSRVG